MTNDTDTNLALYFINNYPDEAAKELESLTISKSLEILANQEAWSASDFWRVLSPHYGALVLSNMLEDKINQLIARLEPQTLVKFIRALDPEQQHKIVSRLPRDICKYCMQHLKYPAQSAGAVMDDIQFSIPHDYSIGETLSHLIAMKYTGKGPIYVTNRDMLLVGHVNLSALLHSNPDDGITSVATTAPQTVPATAPLQKVEQLPAWKNHSRLPVIDGHGALVGSIGLRTMMNATDSSNLIDDGGVIFNALDAYGELLRSFADALSNMIQWTNKIK